MREAPGRGEEYGNHDQRGVAISARDSRGEFKIAGGAESATVEPNRSPLLATVVCDNRWGALGVAAVKTILSLNL